MAVRTMVVPVAWKTASKEAAKFLGRSLGRRAQQAYNEKIVPALAQQPDALVTQLRQY
jgi:hypothetical protein